MRRNEVRAINRAMRNSIVKLFFALLTSAILALAIPVFTQHTPPADTLAITTPQRALDAAISFVGLQTGKQVHVEGSLSEAVQEIRMVDETVPFYVSPDTSRRVQEVRLKLESDSIRGLCSRLVSCVVLFDSHSGGFLQARLPTKDSSGSIELQPASYWQGVLSRAGYSFVGYAEEPPRITLFEAFHAAFLSHPCLGTEVVAWCFLLAGPDDSAIPYWCIVGRSSPFAEMHREKGAPSRDGMPVNYISVIDARTGKPQIVTN